tara:strand:- start:436 stop:909 length:474 start_codon:yes stop_codon:yes gene_type:complete
MREFFEQANADGIIRRVFLGGAVHDADTFLTYFSTPATLAVLVLFNGKISGLGWLSNVEGRSALPNFFFLKSTWGRQSLQMAQMLLRYWFSFPGNGDDETALDILVGMTPAKNRLACRFVKRLGFTIVGEIPRIANGGPMMISFLELEMYKELDNGR